MLDSTATYEQRKEYRDAMVTLLTRKPAHVFATWTFNRSRRDEFELVKAIRMHLFKWEADQAETAGKCRCRVKQFIDGYGRVVRAISKRRGPFVKAFQRGDGLQHAIFVEPHKSGDLHAHGLLWHGRFLGELNRRRGWELWHEGPELGGMSMGMGRFEPPDEAEAVIGYCAKYCLKQGVSLHLSDNLTMPGALLD